MNNTFGFTAPGAQQQYPFYTQQNPMQYQGAMPAAMFGPGAQPMGAVQTPGFNLGGLGMIGANLTQQAQNHQRPVGVGGAIAGMAPGLMSLLQQNPQLMQSMGGGLGGLMGGMGGMGGGAAPGA
ncbi:hypothetical protein [Trinickia sp.]|uniref:hypothetical protein n=1 Tax=Trinickia sp. TaxID=2571163 RepID=UPI003F7DA655